MHHNIHCYNLQGIIRQHNISGVPKTNSRGRLGCWLTLLHHLNIKIKNCYWGNTSTLTTARYMYGSSKIRIVHLFYMVTQPQTYTAQSNCYCVIFVNASARSWWKYSHWSVGFRCMAKLINQMYFYSSTPYLAPLEAIYSNNS